MAYLKGEENLFLKIQNTADSANSLDDDNRRDIADLVRNLLNDDYEIFILTQIVEGRSGSLVFLVEVTDLHSTPRETYPCYLKIHRDADEARAFEMLMADELALLKCMPEIVARAAHRERLAVLSRAAFDTVDPSTIVPLTMLIRSGSPQLQKYLNGVLTWLETCPKAGGGTPMTLYQLLRCTLERSITDYNGRQQLGDFIASEKGVSERLTAWLKPRSPGYLEEHHTEYVSDITPMPSIISHLFALPKIRKYPFRLLLARDENFAKTYPRQAGRFALFLLDGQRTITGLHFLEKPEDLEPLLAPLRGH